MIFITVTARLLCLLREAGQFQKVGASREATDDAGEGQTPLKDRESRKSVPRTKLMAPSPDIAAAWAHCWLSRGVCQRTGRHSSADKVS